MRAIETPSFDAMRASRRLTPRAAVRWTTVFRLAAGLLTALALAACISGARNLSDVVEARGAMNRFAESSMAPAGLERWQRFDQLWLAVRRATERPDLFKRLGLFQGNHLRPALERAYYRAASQMLVAPLLATLERSFETGGSASGQPVNDRRLYQMLHRRPGCELDEALFASRGAELLGADAAISRTREVHEVAIRQLTNLAARERYARVPLEQLPSWRAGYVVVAPPDADAGTFERTYAVLVTGAGRSPVQLIEVLSGEMSRTGELLDGFRQVMLGVTTVEGAFAAEQRLSVLRGLGDWRAAAVDKCVEASGSNTPDIDSAGKARARYISDYVERWKRFLKQTRIREFTLADAPGRLSVLAGDRSPLIAAFAFVSRNTAVDPKKAAAEPAEMTQALTRTFAPVQKVVPPGEDRWTGGWINEVYRKALLDLRDAATAFASEPQNADARRRVREVAGAGISAVDLLALPPGSDGVDRLVKDLLKAPFELTRSRVPENGASELNAMLVPLCRDVMAVRKLMTAQSHGTAGEASSALASVIALYHPTTGSYLRFANSGYVIRGAGADEWGPGPQAAGMTIEAVFLQFMARLSATSRALFGNGSTLGFDYLVDVAPMPSDMAVSLASGGAPGVKEGSAIRLAWPGPRPEEGFALKTPGTSVVYTGPQGLFDLARYNERELGSDRVTVSKARMPGGGFVELQHAAAPASVALRVRGVPAGLDGFWSGASCPSRAARQ